MRSATPDPRPYELLMLGLSVCVLAALAAETLLPLTPATRSVLEYADFAICIVFLADFFVRLARAEDRRAFLKWGWIDLASSIPTLGVARAGRVARIIRIVRLLRAVRSIKHLGAFLLRRRAEAALSAAALIAVLAITSAAITILELEAGRQGANIRTPADALWWALATITTVGYGDRFPVTAEGKMIAAILMIVGISLFSILTGAVASWFVEPARAKQDELARLRAQIEGLVRAVESLRAARESSAETIPR
jgi:voltage-gated potassium channel